MSLNKPDFNCIFSNYDIYNLCFNFFSLGLGLDSKLLYLIRVIYIATFKYLNI